MEMVIQTTHLKTVRPPENYVANNGDCDDNNPDVSSLTSEVCNGYDDDCDELIDSEDSSWDANSGIVVYLDNDGDGSGNLSTQNNVCYLLAGYVTQSGDCVDSDASLNPDDADGDGVTSCDGDCDDSNPAVLPSATEICNEIDDDCDGLLNEEDDSGMLVLELKYLSTMMVMEVVRLELRSILQCAGRICHSNRRLR